MQEMFWSKSFEDYDYGISYRVKFFASSDRKSDGSRRHQPTHGRYCLRGKIEILFPSSSTKTVKYTQQRGILHSLQCLQMAQMHGKVMYRSDAVAALNGYQLIFIVIENHEMMRGNECRDVVWDVYHI